MLLVMDVLLKKKIESCRRDIRKTYNRECNRREVKCEVCGCDLWEQKEAFGSSKWTWWEKYRWRDWEGRGEKLNSAARQIHYSYWLLRIFPYFSWFSVSIWRRRLRFFWFSFCPHEGWKMRLALACAVAQSADVFLLDEPTNHLDSVASQLCALAGEDVKGLEWCTFHSKMSWPNFFKFQVFVGCLSHWLLGIFSSLAIDSHGDYPPSSASTFEAVKWLQNYLVAQVGRHLSMFGVGG